MNKLKLQYWLYYAIFALSAFMLISLIQGARGVSMVPIVDDIRLVDVVTALDALEANNIEAKAFIGEQMLWVDAAYKKQAREILTDIGIEVNSAPQVKSKLQPREVSEQERLMRHLIAVVIIVVLLITVVRPLINDLLTKKLTDMASIDDPAIVYLSAGKFRLLIVSIVGAIYCCMAIFWLAKQPDMRPLINDLTKTDAVLVADVLNQNKVQYYADHKSHMLYVEAEKEQHARLALAHAGIVIDYPAVTQSVVADNSQVGVMSQPLSLTENPALIKLIRAPFAMLCIVIIALVLIKPLLKTFVRVEVEK